MNILHEIIGFFLSPIKENYTKKLAIITIVSSIIATILTIISVEILGFSIETNPLYNTLGPTLFYLVTKLMFIVAFVIISILKAINDWAVRRELKKGRIVPNLKIHRVTLLILAIGCLIDAVHDALDLLSIYIRELVPLSIITLRLLHEDIWVIILLAIIIHFAHITITKEYKHTY